MTSLRTFDSRSNSSSSRLSRRTFLRGLGVALSLPALECMPLVMASHRVDQPPCRMLVIANNLGVLPNSFFPKQVGFDYEPSPYLAKLAEFRRDFTVFSGLSHPGVTGGHSTDNCFLTAARGAFKSGFRNSISLDQFAAEKLGPVTRFPTFNLGINIDKANRSLSWTRDGVLLPAEDSASALFRKMFIRGESADVQRQLQRLEQRGSILDALLDESRRFRQGLGGNDRARLDQYFTSIRDVEARLHATREWEQRPKPVPSSPPPDDIQDRSLFFEKFELMLAMSLLAFESDSTRIITIMADAFFTPVFKLPDHRTSTTYHGLSHHGQDADKVRQLEEADYQQMALLRKLLRDLSAKKEEGERLLDRTMVLYGSNMGDSNIHDNTNLPILLAGGGFRHGQHLAYRRDSNSPLCNLYVSMLQRMGIEIDLFGSSAGTATGLEMNQI